jgi:hypothetical protein
MIFIVFVAVNRWDHRNWLERYAQSWQVKCPFQHMNFVLKK